uniref:Uncharacterized protein n=1 Tax=Clytia hemisphaerica TaxID=252671 RepID=A0A7M5UU91_9CNID
MPTFLSCFVTRIKSKSPSNQPTISLKKSQISINKTYRCGPAKLPGFEGTDKIKEKSNSTEHFANKTRTLHRLGPAKLPSFVDSTTKCNKTVRFRTDENSKSNNQHKQKRTSTRKEKVGKYNVSQFLL